MNTKIDSQLKWTPSDCAPSHGEGDRKEQQRRVGEVDVDESKEDILAKKMEATMKLKGVKFAEKVTYTEFSHLIFFPMPEDLDLLKEQHKLGDSILKRKREEEERERQREQTGRVSQKRLCRR